MKSKSLIGLLIAVTVGLWASAVLAEDTVDSIEKAVVDQWDKLNSMSATLAISADFPMNIVAALMTNTAPSPENKAVGKLAAIGAVDYVKKEGKVCSRLDLAASLNEVLKARGLFVYDGTTANVEYEFFNKINHHTIEPKDMVPPGGKALFDALKENLNLAVQPPEKVNDKDAYVLDAVLKSPDPKIPVSKLRLYFAKDSGVLLKGVVFDTQGAPFGTLSVNDIKLNPTIAADRFGYVPPAPPAPAASAPAAPPPVGNAPAAPKK